MREQKIFAVIALTIVMAMVALTTAVIRGEARRRADCAARRCPAGSVTELLDQLAGFACVCVPPPAPERAP